MDQMPELWDGPVAERLESFAFDPRQSLLIVAPESNQTALTAMAAGADFRVLGAVASEELSARLRRTVGVDTILLDFGELAPDTPCFDSMLTALLAWPAFGEAQLLAIVPPTAMEPVAARLHLDFDRLLCAPRPSDIALALCLLARDGTKARLNDIGRESDAARLDQLSAEVRRLAQTIDRLAHGEERGARSLAERKSAYAPPATEPLLAAIPAKTDSASREEVRSLLNARRLRDRFLPAELFADPAWDMMLDLMAARIDGKRVSVSSLCIAAAVPPTTALRWIAQLTERGIFQRSNDPDDARRVFISLSEETANRLTAWFVAIRRTGLRLTG